MESTAPKSPASRRKGVTLQEVTASRRETLRNLMSLYLHDMSEFTDTLEPGPDGTFAYAGFDLYIDDKALTPLFIYSDGHLAGFALLNQPPYTPADVDWSINEFFVMRRFRGLGVGRRAAAQIFKQFTGRYLIAQLAKNVPAIGFWHSLYAHLKIDFTERKQTSRGEPILTQRFVV